MKTLVAYFSHTGENYFGGTIRNISKGNTEVVAEFVQKACGGDLFEIKTVKEYPVNYKECCDVAQAEGRAGERPELKGSLPDIAGYDRIILGYPCWWGTMPQAVFTFLESGDFSGKTIFPFCTHEGSGMGRSESDIKKLCPGSTVVKGLAVKGSSCGSAENSVKAWLGIK
ncbi:flavodoxin [Treponema sp.]|uniref:flavodoxin n=1 Tax=Treponema sp. TaxID=166 RepID=UPI00257D90EE|nr:flavodoxin [Treponema sp.]MBE6355134.1 flavodoxin [Treponema sp.]